MRLPRLRRPSPAFVLALLALLVASGVPADAARLITGRDIRNNSVTGAKLVDHSVRGVKIRRGTITGFQVRDKSLSPADFSGSVQGPAGPQGPAGTAKAYANVSGGGVLNPLASKAIGRVVHPAAGLYCFYLAFHPANVQATLDAYRSPQAQFIKATNRPDDRGGNQCPGSESASVRTIQNAKKRPTNHDADFFVEFN